MWTPKISNRDIKKVKCLSQEDSDLPTLYVKDSYLFFNLLLDIVNESLLLNYKYGFHTEARTHCIGILNRLWLRMGPSDFNNVELFLKKQLEFLRNDWLDIDYEKACEKIDDLGENKVLKSPFVSYTWDETFREVSFLFSTPYENYVHELPNVRYGLALENGERVCYIYAVQTDPDSRSDKKIERQLYKICNKNGDLGVHPNQVYGLYLFLKELEKIGVTKIKIPVIQVLNYPYHELMYPNTKDVKRGELSYSEYISYLKTEKLFNLMETMNNFFDDLYLINDLDTACDTFDYAFNSNKNKVKTK